MAHLLGDYIKTELGQYENKPQRELLDKILTFNSILDIIERDINDPECQYKPKIHGLHNHNYQKFCKVVTIYFDKMALKGSVLKSKEKIAEKIQKYLTPLTEYYTSKKTENEKQNKIKMAAYLKQRVKCECEIEVPRRNMSVHRKTKKHTANMIRLGKSLATKKEIADYNQAENDDEDEETSAGEDDD